MSFRGRDGFLTGSRGHIFKPEQPLGHAKRRWIRDPGLSQGCWEQGKSDWGSMAALPDRLDQWLS